MRVTRGIVVIAFVLIVVGIKNVHAAAPKVGGEVEVKSGGSWVAATVKQINGDQFLVEYEDGSTEWVGADRILHSGGGSSSSESPTGGGQASGASNADSGATAPPQSSDNTAAAGAPAPAAGQILPGSTIEVREGDTWSKVSVVNVNGDKILVQYDDGTREWIGPDRVKPSGGDGSAPSGDSAAPAPRAFRENEAVEAKRDKQWRPAHISQISNGWILIIEDQDHSEMRWTAPWYVRVVGANYDVGRDGMDLMKAQPGEVAPTRPPRDPPSAFGDQFVVASMHLASTADLTDKAESVSFDNMHEPAPGAAPAPLATTQPNNEFSAWSVRGATDSLGAILPIRNSLRVAVAAFPGQFGRWTEIIRVNLPAKAQMEKRMIYISDLKVLAAAEDGDLLLSGYEWDKYLQLWKWDGGNYQLVESLTLGDAGFGIADSADFVAPDRAVIALGDQSVFLVDLTNKRVISSVKRASGSHVYVSPGGSMVGIITEGKTALLLNSKDFSTIAEYTDAAGTGNLTVDPTGQYAAYLNHSGNVRVTKIADNTTVGQAPMPVASNERIDLVDSQFLVRYTLAADSGDTSGASCIAYDMKAGVPVWIYNLPGNARIAALANGQFLIGYDSFGRVEIAAASIPDQVGRNAAANALPSMFMLAPGMPVKIDADYGAFGDDRQKAQDAVENIVRRAGLKISDHDEPFHLSLSIAPGPTEKRDYAPGPFSWQDRHITTVDVSSNILTVTLLFKGKPAWEQKITFAAGGSLTQDANHSFQDEANLESHPNAAGLSGLRIPSFLPVGATPGTPAALGVSDLKSRRFAPRRSGVTQK